MNILKYATTIVGIISTLTVGCSSETALLSPTQGVALTGVVPGLGAPCTPTLELDPAFSGFSVREVSLETNNPQCGANTCLVNHFRGRTTCPLGQDRLGASAAGQSPACVTPESNERVSGQSEDTARGKCVQPQCSKRPAEKSVYCSCRCANVDGRTDDGSTYCGCGAGFECAQLVGSSGPGSEALAGGYCIKQGTKYDASQDSCGPAVEGGVTSCPD
jgi:hypothetical protein